MPNAKSTKTGKHVWIYTGNKFANVHGNILSLSENIAKSFRGVTFFDSHRTSEN